MKFDRLFVLVALTCLTGISTAEDLNPKHLVDAKEIVKKLDLSNTNYEHGEGNIVWGGTPESHTDCSGFIDLLLTHSYGYDRADYKKWFNSHRPSAARYHDAIVEQIGFTRIVRVHDVHPGDLLAVKYLKRKDNTGHVMLVSETPHRMNLKKPVIDQTEQWEVGVIDSSQSGHGPTDTRHKKGKNGKDHDGLGHGVLRLYADHAGQIAGFAWSTLDASEFKDPTEEPLVIGRLKPQFKP